MRELSEFRTSHAQTDRQTGRMYGALGILASEGTAEACWERLSCLCQRRRLVPVEGEPAGDGTGIGHKAGPSWALL